jgi:hypothetical protein
VREIEGSKRVTEMQRRPAGDGNLPLLLRLRRWCSSSTERDGEQGLARWALGGKEKWMGVNGVKPVAQTRRRVVLIGRDWLGWRCSVDGVVDWFQ